MWSIILNDGKYCITRHAFTIANLYKEEAEKKYFFSRNMFAKVGLKYNQFTDKEKEKGIEPTLTTPEVEAIYRNYSAKIDGSKNLNGGRVENRKYFTLNWSTPIDYEEPTTAFLLSDMYYSSSESYYNRKEIDTRLLYYEYYWIDLKEAARRGKISTSGTVENNYRNISREPLGKDNKNDGHRSTLDANGNVWLDTTVSGNKLYDEEGVLLDSNRNANYTSTILENPGQDLDLGYTNSKGQHNAIRGHTDRSRFIIKEKINIYPDTLCWMRDHTF
jgi:hypothetical protein